MIAITSTWLDENSSNPPVPPNPCCLRWEILEPIYKNHTLKSNFVANYSFVTYKSHRIVNIVYSYSILFVRSEISRSLSTWVEVESPTTFLFCVGKNKIKYITITFSYFNLKSRSNYRMISSYIYLETSWCLRVKISLQFLQIKTRRIPYLNEFLLNAKKWIDVDSIKKMIIKNEFFVILTWSQTISHFFFSSYCFSSLALSGGRSIEAWNINYWKFDKWNGKVYTYIKCLL